ncbi:MAG TPA: succinylglutamate desuccinylase/aspartoacylase family protein [Gammaproteobacteria bacterium]|nr:succinylglutamate desuccinylase/aspartoacylase family protein [Gammaproteobacteria bacterium]
MDPRQIIRIGDTIVHPGEKTLIELPVAGLYTHTAITLPVHVINGHNPGPRLFVSAAVHGDELNGVEIIRRLLHNKTLKRLNGSLIAIPVVNMFGLVQHSRYLPDRRDLNRSFPGSKQGPLASRLAWIFMEHIVKQCTHGIDLHTGASHRCNLPQIRANMDDYDTKELAKAFGVPVLINSNVRDGSLRGTADQHGVISLLYEAGESLRFDEQAIRIGVRGILNVMHKLNMLPLVKHKPHGRKSAGSTFTARSNVWVRASHSGIFRSLKGLGEKVNTGALLGVITDPTDMFDEGRYEVRAQASGLIIGKTNLPLVNEGDALYNIARIGETAGKSSEVEIFPQEILPV